MPLLTLPDVGAHGLSERAKALVFEDASSRALLEQIEACAGREGPLLVLGEVGTGRELVARHVHDLGMRAKGPFLSANCSAFSGTSVENALFGQAARNHANATPARIGWLEAAQGGTLYLDAVADLPLLTQAKLVKALKEHSFKRLGSRRPQALDVRVIGASDIELEEAVRAGRFRADLLRLLSSATLRVLPLRERPGDILPLARHFLQVYQQKSGIGARTLSPETEALLLSHAWPGNIRELETAIHHALLRCRGRALTPAELRLTGFRAATNPFASPILALERALQQLIEQSPPNLHELVEQTVLRTAYRHAARNQLQTARLLGISRNVVRARLIHYGEIAGFPRSLERASRQAAEGKSATRTLRRVRIGYQRGGLLKLLRARGSFEARLAALGLRVEWQHYPSGLRLIEAFRSNAVDLGVVGEGPPIFAQAAEIPIVYVAADPAAPQAEAIVVHADSPIRETRDLRGKKLALLHGSSAHYLVIRALEEAELGYEQVTLDLVFPEAARLAFESREVDAWAVSDPTLAEIQQSLSVRVLRDGRGLAQNPTYYIASPEFASQNAATVSVLREELKLTARWAADNVEAAADSLAPRLGISKRVLGQCLGRSLGEPLSAEEMLSSQQRVADAFYRLKLIARPVQVSEAYFSADAAYIARSA